ncbi:MAG: ribonuclease catalytic domain-containing protein [Halodesulfovibrio sp.]|uniref:ribonuclease catalytic domain-containing protein n=1 Tax=Halodesulfovibrio sp. TaxID=1912772 RepID=UPI00359E7A11
MSAPSLVRYPGPGCVVEFMHGNKAQQGWVLDEQGGKLRLLTINKREMKLASSRVLPWAGPSYSGERSRQEIGALLEEHRATRDAMSAEIDALELWDFAQGEVDKETIQWFAELLWEEPSIDQLAALGSAMLTCKTHFKFQPPEFEIYPADKVEKRQEEDRKRLEREALVTQGVGFFRTLWESHSKGRALGKAPDEGVAEQLKEIILNKLSDPDSHEVDQVWKQLAKGLPEDPHMALHLARAWDLVPPHHNFWLDRADYECTNNWAEEFTSDVQAIKDKCLSIHQKPEERTYISIDSATTKDIDDAFNIERRGDGGYRLRISLACPAVAWPFGSRFDKEVLRRATSVYLPEGDCHMMPTTLGTDFFSLHANEDRPSLILDIECSSTGELERCTPVPVWVNLAANLTYIDSEAVINGGGEDTPAGPFAEQIALGSELSDKLQEQRIASGAVIIERNDPKVKLSGEGSETKVEIVPADDTPKAMKLVSEMMILANSGVAAWAKEHGVTLLHRTQDVAVPKEYVGVWSAPHDIARVVKALSSAILETTPRPHRGIGVNAYSPITSPLRRYPDLVNVAQVIHYTATGEAQWTTEEITAMLPLLNARLDSVGQIQRFRPRYWKLLYFKQQGDKVWREAIVTEENDAFVTVSLPNEQIFVRGRRKSFGDKVNPGQLFMVRIGKVHPLNNEIQILDAMES